MSKLILFLVAAYYIVHIQSANILLSCAPQSRSHATTFAPVLQRLAADGHNVTLHFDIFKPELPIGDGSVHEHLIELKDYPDPMAGPDAKKFGEMFWTSTLSPLMFPFIYYFTSAPCAHHLNHQVNSFWQLANQSWDLVLTDALFSPCAYALSLVNNSGAYVMMHPCDLVDIHSMPLALGRNPVVVPPNFIRHHNIAFDVSVFFDRLGSMIDYLSFAVLSIPIDYIIRWTIRPITNRYEFDRYTRNAGLHFVDDPYAFSWNQPIANDIISYGSICKSGKRLADEYEQFINADPSAKGTIFVAFGTVANWNTVPNALLDAFVNAFNNLTDYRIIWSYKGPAIATREHILVKSWLPQVEILEHHSTRLFVSHGGLKSIKEAICSETPALYMPIFAEQVRNSLHAHHIGFGEFVNKLNVSDVELEQKMRHILDDNKYSHRIGRLRRQFDDRINNVLDTSAFWFRKLIEYGGRLPTYFYRVGMQLNAIAYLNLDILSAIILIVTVISQK